MASLVTTTINGTLTGNSSATFDGRVQSNNELRVSNDYSVNYFYKTNNTTMLGYLLMRDDNNSFLSFPAAQDFRFLHGNTSRIAVKTDGNVGIGTTNPTEKLEITGNVRIMPSSGDAKIRLTDQGVRSWDLRVSDGSDYFEIDGTTSTSLVIRGSGNVGIGTASPNSKLQVFGSTSGDSMLKVDGTNGTLFEVVDDLSDSLMSVNDAAGLPVFEVFADNHIVAGRYNLNDFYLDTNGNLGLGTNAPSSVLDIYEQSGKDNKLRFHSSTTGSGTSNGSRIGLNGGELFINNIENAAIKIYTQSNQTNGVTILGDGKVGIGTVSPSVKLHAVDTVTDNSSAEITRIQGTSSLGTTNTSLRFTSASSAGTATNRWFGLQAYDHNPTARALVLQHAGGNVGIGTTIPLQKLDVIGRIRSSFNSGDYFEMGSSDSGGFLLGFSGTTEVVNVRTYGDSYFNGGNVGIGNTVSQAHTNENTSTVKLRVGSDTLTSNQSSAIQIGGYDSGGNGTLGAVEFFNHRDNSIVAKMQVRRDLNSSVKLSAGQLDFYTDDGDNNLNLQMSINALGNVGIGTTSPDERLHVSVASGGAAKIKIDSSDASRNNFIGVFNHDNLILAADHDNEGGDSSIRMSVDGSEKVRIVDNGNFGIGTTIPVTKLHGYTGTTGARNAPIDVLTLETEHTNDVEYNGFGQGIVFRGSTYNQNSQRTLGRILHQINDDSGNTTRGTSMSFQTSDNGANANAPTTKVTIDYKGDVGIGTPSPAARLQVNQVASDQSGAAAIKAIGTAYGTNKTIHAYMGTTSSTKSLFYAENSNGVVMNIAGDGNVGIGTDSPDNKLTIADFATIAVGKQWGLDFQDILKGEPQAYIYAEGRYSANYNTDLVFGTIGTSGSAAERMRIDSSGDVGIGTTVPDAGLHVVNSGDPTVLFESTNAGSSGSRLQLYHNSATPADNDIISNIQITSKDSNNIKRYAAAIQTIAADVNASSVDGDIRFLTYKSDTASEVMRITHDKTVGVGIAPKAKFEVDLNQTNGTLAADNYAHFGGQHMSNGYVMGITLGYREANLLYRKVGIVARGLGDTHARQDLDFLVSTATGSASVTPSDAKLTISGLTGNVGIGTTSPGAKLDVYDSTGTSLTQASVLKLQSYTNAVGEGPFVDFHSRWNGNFPNWILGRIGAVYETASGGSNEGALVFWTNNSNDAAQGLSGTTEKMRIQGDGNVGIGTVDPDAKLEIKSDGSAAGGAEIRLTHANNNANDVISTINFSNNTGSAAMIQGGTTGANNTGYISLFTDNAGTSSEKVRIIGDGNVGIGTAIPTGKLQIGDSYTIDSGLGGNDIYIKGTTGRTSYDPNIYNTDVFGALITISDNNTVGPTKPGLVLYNDDVTAGGFSPMLLFCKRESGNSPFKATMAGIYARSPLGTGDGNSWIDGELIFATAGAASQGVKQRMVINKEGLVGIGTVSPNTKLNIKGDQSANGQLYIEPTNDGEYAGLVIKTTRGADRAYAIFAGGTGTDDLNFRFRDYTASTDRMVIDSAGKVGVGTAVPSQALTVAGKIDTVTAMGVAGQWSSSQIRLETTNTVDTTGWQGISFDTSTTDNYGWSIGVNRSSNGRGSFRVYEHVNSATGAERFTIKQDGHVGIGTTDPSNPLDVVGYIKSSIGFKAGNYTTMLESGNESVFGNTAYYGVLFKTNNATRMKITNAGDVGIGTATPSQKLHVVGKALITDDVQLTGSNPRIDFNTNGASSLRFYDTANAAERMRINTSGNLGINTTSPTSKLQIIGSTSGDSVLRVDGTSGTIFEVTDDLSNSLMSVNTIAGLPVFEVFADNHIVAGRYNQNDFYLNTDGNLGLGTGSPDAKLHIKAPASSVPAEIRLEHNSGGTQTAKIVFDQSGQNKLVLSTQYQSSTDLNLIQFAPADNVAMTIRGGTGTSDGFVGIGTTSPSARLQVKDSVDNSYESGLSVVRSADNATTWINVRGGATNFNNRNHAENAGLDYRWFQNGSEKMRLNTNGNLGIGTVGPSQKLHVNGLTKLGESGKTEGGAIIGLSSFGETKGVLSTILGNSIVPGTASSTIQRSTSNIAHFLKINETSGITFHTGLQTTEDANVTESTNEKVRIDISGKVGIGTASPAYKLDVNAGLSAGGGIAYPIRAGHGSMATAGDGVGILFNRGSAEQYNGYIRIQSTVSNPSFLDPRLEFGIQDTGTYNLADASTRMVITGSGNIGIGTVSPASKLQIVSSTSGDSVLKVDGTNGTLFEVVDDLSDSLMSVNDAAGLPVFEVFADNHIVAGRYNQNDFYLNTNGNLGLGTSAPSYKLDIGGATSSTVNTLRLHQANGGTAIRVGPGGGGNDITLLRVDGTTSNNSGATDSSNVGFSLKYMGSRDGNLNALSIFTDNVTAASQIEAVTIIQDGNVGIGTASPSTKLHIVGDNGDQLKLDNDGDQFTQINFANNNSTKTFITLDHTGHKFIIGAQGSYSDLDYISFRPDGTNDDMVIQRDGNVGIGTSTANYKLHVVGTTHVTSTFTVGNGGGGGGIAVSPGGSTDIYALRVARSGSSGTSVDIYDLHSNSVVIGATSSEKTLTVKAGGWVGIGATNPAYGLDNNRTSVRTNSYTAEKVFGVSFPNSTANQKVDISFPYFNGTMFWGYLEVTLTSTYSNQLSTGKLSKVFAVGLNNPGGTSGNYTAQIYDNTNYYTSVYGALSSQWGIEGINFNTTTGQYYITIAHRVSTGNGIRVSVKAYGYSPDYLASNRFGGLTAGSVYTTDATAFDAAVKEVTNLKAHGSVDITSSIGIGSTLAINRVVTIGNTAGTDRPAIKIITPNFSSSTSSTGKTFYRWMPIDIDGTTRWIAIYS